MSAAAEVQSGKGQIFGIVAMTMTPSGGSAIAGNMSNHRWPTSWKADELSSQNGATVESQGCSQNRETIEIDFAPTSTTRALAKAEADKVIALTPNQVVTIASDDQAALNGTWNYKGGATLTRIRDGVGVSSIKLERYETTTAGTYAALAII